MKRSSFTRYGDTFDSVFENNEKITLSRADVFKAFSQDPAVGALKAIAWGFPRGNRPGGRTLQAAINAIPFMLKQIESPNYLTREIYEKINSLPDVKNGVTTKLLHFSGITTQDGHRAQIYDSRIHQYLMHVRPEEYAPLIATMRPSTSFPSADQYLNYLRITEAVMTGAGYEDPSSVEIYMFTNAPGKRSARHKSGT